MAGRAYMGEGLAEIHQEISEHKQVNAKKESLKKFCGSQELWLAHENKSRIRKNNTHIKCY